MPLLLSRALQLITFHKKAINALAENQLCTGNQVERAALAAPLQPLLAALERALVAKPRVAVGSTHPGVRFERSSRSRGRAGSRPHNTKASLSLKLYWAQGAKDITRKRAKALATNALDVGQPQPPSGSLTTSHASLPAQHKKSFRAGHGPPPRRDPRTVAAQGHLGQAREPQWRR